MHRRLVSLCGTLSICLLVSSGQAAPDPTVGPRAVYNEINNNIKTFEVVRANANINESEAEIKGWMEGSALRKVEVGEGGDHGTTTTEFYYEDGMLVFAYEVVTTQRIDSNKVEARIDNRFYFADGSMTRWLNSDKEIVPKSSENFRERERQLISKSDLASAALASKFTKKPKGDAKLSKGENVTKGTFSKIEQGDFSYLVIKTAEGGETSFFLLNPDSSLAPILANPGKFAGAKSVFIGKSRRSNCQTVVLLNSSRLAREWSFTSPDGKDPAYPERRRVRGLPEFPWCFADQGGFIIDAPPPVAKQAFILNSAVGEDEQNLQD